MFGQLRCQYPVHEPIQEAIQAIRDIDYIFKNFIAYRDFHGKEYQILFEQFKSKTKQVFLYCRTNGIDIENPEEAKHLPDAFNSLAYPIQTTARALKDFLNFLRRSLESEFNDLRDYT